MVHEMARDAFEKPLKAFVDPRRPDLGTRLIATVSDGLAAIYGCGLLEVRDGSRSALWDEAADALCRASLEPDAATLKAARGALDRLLKAVAPISNRRRRALVSDELAIWYLMGGVVDASEPRGRR
ncbi:hypothetical protein [Methylobacterium symbioticum]|jgi:hypothetical protein|uniref:Uncharacterized protein n=1 Tax=Methylobacterium symbioticum TaxID=2584084 RepID=A0A509EF71_9HYPH|nr:hypothetical protein [Methylobacterium symbioticum]VUD72798.1 hypothetical protein MET9862_03402 [Methylobacterium symbioticum]